MHSDTWLSRFGGWLLVAVGAALICLASIFSDRPAVAPAFAVGGVALVVLGVVLPRVEGPFEFSATGFKLVFAELKSETFGEPDRVKAMVLDYLTSGTLDSTKDPKRLGAALVTAARGHYDLQDAVGAWLVADGWRVREADRLAGGMDTSPAGVDVVGEREDEVVLGIVKTRFDGWDDAVDALNELKRASAMLQGSSKLRVALFVGEMPTFDDWPFRGITKYGFEVWLRDGERFVPLGAGEALPATPRPGQAEP